MKILITTRNNTCGQIKEELVDSLIERLNEQTDSIWRKDYSDKLFVINEISKFDQNSLERINGHVWITCEPIDASIEIEESEVYDLNFNTKLSPENFVNSLLKLSKEDQRTAFRLLCTILQNQIIGYINVGGIFEPAISDHESFCPLTSFGISNTFIHNRFIPFENGKTLLQMLDDPFGFDKWCKENLK